MITKEQIFAKYQPIFKKHDLDLHEVKENGNSFDLIVILKSPCSFIESDFLTESLEDVEKELQSNNPSLTSLYIF